MIYEAHEFRSDTRGQYWQLFSRNIGSEYKFHADKKELSEVLDYVRNSGYALHVFTVEYLIESQKRLQELLKTGESK